MQHVTSLIDHKGQLLQDNWEWNYIELQKDAAQPSARDFACMVALEGGRLLVHGGLDATERRLDDTWLFDTVTYANNPAVQALQP